MIDQDALEMLRGLPELMKRQLDRISLLEETLRGILQEKRDDLAHEIHVGTRPTEKIEREIAWLESVLGGGK